MSYYSSTFQDFSNFLFWFNVLCFLFPFFLNGMFMLCPLIFKLSQWQIYFTYNHEALLPQKRIVWRKKTARQKLHDMQFYSFFQEWEAPIKPCILLKALHSIECFVFLTCKSVCMCELCHDSSGAQNWGDMTLPRQKYRTFSKPCWCNFSSRWCCELAELSRPQDWYLVVQLLFMLLVSIITFVYSSFVKMLSKYKCTCDWPFIQKHLAI